MKKSSTQIQISKKELEKADANLLPPTQNVSENLARGEDDLVPDPDDIPGGLDSTLNQQLSNRPNLMQADARAIQESKEGKGLHSDKKKKRFKKG